MKMFTLIMTIPILIHSMEKPILPQQTSTTSIGFGSPPESPTTNRSAQIFVEIQSPNALDPSTFTHSSSGPLTPRTTTAIIQPADGLITPRRSSQHLTCVKATATLVVLGYVMMIGYASYLFIELK